MKKHQLILASSVVFTLLIYDQNPGVNISLFCLFLVGMIYYFFKDRFTDSSYFVLTTATILSSLVFAWYVDGASFFAMSLSLIFLQFKTQDSKLKIILSFPMVFLNGFASIVRIFQFNQWLPEKKIDNSLLKKLIAYVFIPTLFLGVFFVVYSFGSDHFSGLFTNYTLDLKLDELLGIGLFGFYISFTFWNYWVPQYCYDNNSKLDDDFSIERRSEHHQTFSFLDLEFERKSGEITMLLLNLMLLIFIGTYNYEQFFEQTAIKTLSAATHERVNAVIFSIIMAVGVVLFFFKNGFNFDEKAKNLKVLSKVWIVLNGVLILSTIIKNSEYVSFYGLTYKRLGVYAFLILAMIGLVFTFLKIYKQKTNVYLFNKMVWYFYGTILLCSFVNWGNLITYYNISVNKGVEPEFLRSLDFNEERCLEYLSTKPEEVENIKKMKARIKQEQNKSFLSKALYYESITIE